MYAIIKIMFFGRAAMLDKRRIRLMTKLALYEQSDAKEDLKVSGYYKEDYAGLMILKGALWTTVGYAMVAVLFVLCNLDLLINDMSVQKLIVLACAVVGGYLVLLIVFCICASVFYKRKHVEARHRLKTFYNNLTVLERMGGHTRPSSKKRRKMRDKLRAKENIL